MLLIFYKVYSFAHDVLSPTVRLSNCSKNIIVDEESLRQKKSDNSCNSSLTPCLPLNISSAQKVERWLEKTAFEKAVIYFYFLNFANSFFLCMTYR